MRNVVLVGAGQLGSRHLQALAKSEMPISIHVIDPNPDSLRNAELRFAEVDRAKGITATYHSNWEGIPDEVDMALIATNADIRAKVVGELLQRAEVEAIIFEKVLFSMAAEFEVVEAMLRKRRIRAWVNCPRRKMPVYRLLKDVIAGGRVTMVVNGGNFGLGCNAIHFIDLFAFLTGCSEFDIDASGLDPGYIPSKRSSYLEFTGQLRALGSDGSQLVMLSSKNYKLPMSITISAENATGIIDEAGGIARLAGEFTGYTWREEPFRIPYQSEMTHLDLKAVAEGRDPGLVTFAESKSLHLPLLKAYLNHLDLTSDKKGLERCPIT